MNTDNFVNYEKEVKHIFIHSLIAYPEVLHKKSNNIINIYEKDCMYYSEFNNMLFELYKNKYVLINIKDTYSIINGTAKKNKVKVPKDKKPLVISVDDVVYDPKKSGNGMIDKIILDEHGNLASQTTINNKTNIAYDREFFNILENFITKHPDFSLNNARATINLTGFCGILGYRTSCTNKELRLNEVLQVKPVISKLKSLGYNFACHSFGHYHIKKSNTQQIKQDLDDWSKYVEPLIGKTDIFVYPYGEWELVDDNNFSKKQQLLCDYGFKLFCGVGIYDFYTHMPLNKNIKQKILFWDRKAIDGTSLTTRKNELLELFDTSKVISKYRLNT